MDGMTDRYPPCHSEMACAKLLRRFLLTPAELLQALAPEGWERSPLLLVFHPTIEQRREEWESLQGNIDGLLGDAHGASIEPPREEGSSSAIRTVQPEREVVELLGQVLWDVFANNHTVVDQGGIEFDLGSFRASAALIADQIDETYPELRSRYDYLDFYMGSGGLHRRADLRPAYRWVFLQLCEVGCDWRYSFPRLHLISFDDLTEPADPLTYDPSESVRAELEASERRGQTTAFAQELDRRYDEAVEEAYHGPPPTIVNAYRDVFGRYPAGWPPRRSDA